MEKGDEAQEWQGEKGWEEKKTMKMFLMNLFVYGHPNSKDRCKIIVLIKMQVSLYYQGPTFINGYCKLLQTWLMETEE